MAKNASFLKIKIRRSLGVVRECELVEKYFSREDADNCTLEGTIYSAPEGYRLLKKYKV